MSRTSPARTATETNVLGEIASALRLVLDADLGEVQPHNGDGDRGYAALQSLGRAIKPWAECMLVRVDSGGVVTIEFVSLDSATLRAAEKLTGLTVPGLRIPVERWPAYNEVLVRGRSLFLEESYDAAVRTLPKFAAPVARRVLGQLKLDSDTRAIHVPVRHEGHVVGSLVIWGHSLQPELVPLVEEVAVRIGFAPAATDLARIESARRNSEQALLLRLARRLSRATHAAEVASIAVDETQRLLGGAYCEIGLLDPATGQLRGAADPHTLVPDDSPLAHAALGTEVIFGGDPDERDQSDPVHPDYQSGACVPIGLAGDTSGSLCVYWDRATRATEEERRLLQAVARETGHALTRSRLYEAERRRTSRQQRVVEAAGRLIGVLEQDELFRAVLAAVADVTDAEKAAVFLYDIQADEVTCVGSSGLSESYIRMVCRQFRDLPGARVLLNPQPQVCEDVSADEATAGILHLLEGEGIAAYVVFPMVAPEGVIGALVGYRGAPTRFSEGLIAAGQTLAHISAIAIQNAELVAAQQARVKELEVLHAVAVAGTGASSESELIEAATQIIGSALYPDNFGILLIQDKDRLRPHPSYRGVDRPESYLLAPGQGVTGRVAASGVARRLDDVSADDDFIEVTPGMRSELCVPIELEQRIIGVINAESRRAGAFSASDEMLVTTLAGQLAIGIEKARLLAALRDSEARYRAVAESAVEAVVSADPAGRIVSWNPAAKTIFGHTERQAIGRPVTMLFPARKRRYVDRFLAAFNEGGQRPRSPAGRMYQILGQRASGEAFPMEVSVAAWRAGESRYLTGIVRDVTERVEADRALKARAEELEVLTELSSLLRESESVDDMLPAVLRHSVALTHAVGAGIFLRDEDGTLTLMGVYPDRPGMVGFQLEEGHGVTGLVSSMREAYVVDSLAADPNVVLPPMAPPTDEVSSVISLPLRARDRSLGVLHVAFPADSAPAPSATRFLTAIADMAGIAINRARVMETLEERVAQRTAELGDANRRLKELDQLKSKFVADVSHELRTPVSNLRLYLHLLDRGSTDKRGRYLEVLKEQTQRLASLIDDILDLGRLDMSGTTLEPRPTGLNLVVDGVVRDHLGRAKAKGLALRFQAEPELPLISADATQLAKVVTNLLGNAVSYTEAGSIEVETFLDGREVGLRITDTGVGVHTEDLPHLFDRFYRGRAVSQRGIPGTGLGLAIVKEIVDLHGGSIRVRSEPDAGSAFEIRLPLVQGPTEPKTHEEADIERQS